MHTRTHTKTSKRTHAHTYTQTHTSLRVRTHTHSLSHTHHTHTNYAAHPRKLTFSTSRTLKLHEFSGRGRAMCLFTYLFVLCYAAGNLHRHTEPKIFSAVLHFSRPKNGEINFSIGDFSILGRVIHEYRNTSRPAAIVYWSHLLDTSRTRGIEAYTCVSPETQNSTNERLCKKLCRPHSAREGPAHERICKRVSSSQVDFKSKPSQRQVV